jgi:hypothetical protein
MAVIDAHSKWERTVVVCTRGDSMLTPPPSSSYSSWFRPRWHILHPQNQQPLAHRAYATAREY